MTRRGYIRSVSAGALAVGGTTLAGTAAAQETDAKLVFVYDDGYVEDYTQTFTIHQQLDAPACAAVPSDVLGRSDEFLSEEQLTEMSNAGWEVMSHAISHDALGAVTATADVQPSDTRVYVDSTVLGRTPHEAAITQGDKRVTRKITGDGEDDQGGYLKFDSEIGSAFAAGETQIQYTEEVLHRIMKQSKQSLEDRGFNVTNFVYPYGRYNQQTKSVLKEHYNGVANAYPGGLNTAAVLDPYELRREYFAKDDMTESELAEYMDRVASRGTLGNLGGHIRNPELTGERVQLAIEMARERNIEIVTLQQAFEDFGVYESTATPTSTPSSSATGSPTTSPTRTPAPNGGGGFFDDFFAWLNNLL